MRLNVDVEGTEQLEEAFDGLHARSVNLRPAFEVIGDDFRGIMRNVFSTRGRTVGGWMPLQPRYAARKARLRPGAPQGVFTGLLRASLTSKGARYARQRIEERAITVGTKAPHAHLFRNGRSTQPARPLIPAKALMSQRWSAILSDHVAGRDMSARHAGII